MSRVVLDVSVSLDGFTTGPNVRQAEPMGDGGEHLHEWMAGNGTDGEGSGPGRVGELTGVELVAAVMARMRQDRGADHLVTAVNSAQQSARERRITTRPPRNSGRDH